MYVLLAIVGLVAAVSANDLDIGHEGGRLTFEQNFTASPAIWKQAQIFTVNVSDSEVISRVAIIDHRENKDGESSIVKGGEGHKNVTILLKGPAIFRGFDFEVKVFAEKADEVQKSINDEQQNTQDNLGQDTDVNDKQVPKEETDEVIKGLVTPVPSISTTQVPDGQDKVQHPAVVGRDDNQQVRPGRDTQGQQPEQNPALVDKDVQSAKDNKKSDEATIKQGNGFNPMMKADDWNAMVDEIFNQNSTETKTTTDFSVEEGHHIDINGPGTDETVIAREAAPETPVEVLPIATTISTEGQQTEKTETKATDSQEAKVQVNVPLPYLKN